MIFRLLFRPMARRPKKGDAVFYTDGAGKVHVYQVVQVQRGEPSTIARDGRILDRLRLKCEAVDFDNVFVTAAEMVRAHNEGFHIKARKRD